jgi:hypothetical protein
LLYIISPLFFFDISYKLFLTFYISLFAVACYQLPSVAYTFHTNSSLTRVQHVMTSLNFHLFALA